ncbi:hypothetical protein NSK_004535 [Nannochloropsis salina CCMP1776]|uniref:PsbP C-terminal domain-containing protein n=1 Tax=Nannochloropsis salina CCMP1776 TaxID=1027361 RepID=A0A4D9CXM7_9STRA|nr:hypothetical protein NSK_004535 [Nannochloropsis salina CCMP1776]|eukprot:TFJ84062.1 hypothetical protein NSK_004535 [Nannochloropsis salina CCMP1776]
MLFLFALSPTMTAVIPGPTIRTSFEVLSVLTLLAFGNAFAPAASSRGRSPRLLTRSAEGTPLVSRSTILQQGGLISSAGILALTGSPFLLNIETASADEAGAAGEQSYFDEKYKVAFEHIPAKWGRTDTTIGTNNLDPRRIVVFKDPSSEANVFIAYTPVQPDFTTLGAFGSILDVAKTIVPKGRGVESKLLNYEGRKGAYYYDYVIQPAGQPKRHLTTLFALITISGTGECLATYTTSCLEDQWTVLEPVFDKITKSFRVGL